MTEKTETGRRQSPADIGGRSLLITLALSLGIVAGLFGIVVTFGRQLTPALVSPPMLDLGFGLTAYAAIFLALWVTVAGTGGSLRDIGFRHCDRSLYITGIFLALLWIGVTSVIYSAVGQWALAIAAGRTLVAPFLANENAFLLLLVMAGPVAALVEEALFRGMIYGWLRKRLGIALSALISGIVFTAAHFYVYTAGPAFVAEMLMLSILLALLFEVSRSLWPGILCHAANNLVLLSIYVSST